MQKTLKVTLAGCALTFVALAAQAVQVNVPGTSDPWLAGQPDGTTASYEDSAPGQSPVLVDICLEAGSKVWWSASGWVNNVPAASGFGPDGGAAVSHATGAENGISNVTSPINALLGVFFGPGGVPSALDFSAVASQDYLSLSPAVNQVFFMGDGKTSSGAGQQVLVPAGATGFYLGTMDGYGWWNNSGSFDVSLRYECNDNKVPETAQFCWLTLAAVGAVGGWLRRRNS